MINKHQQLRAIGRVARVTKIADADEPVASPIQQHEVGRRSRGIAGIAYQNRWASVDESRNELPVLHQRVIAEIFADLASCSRFATREVRVALFR